MIKPFDILIDEISYNYINSIHLNDKDYVAYSVEVNWGIGGHSGVDINSGRANAIKILANLLLVAIRQVNIKLYLVSFEGGQAYSAIPGEAEAKIVIPKENIEEFEILVSQCNDAVKAQFSETDPNVEVVCEPSVWHSNVINEEGTHLLLACICYLRQEIYLI